MNRWLLKTEPSTYSWDDLVREGWTAWTGVANPQAQAHLRAMRVGDEAVVYHTGSEKAAVGVAEVLREAYPEPGGDGLACVDLKPGVRLATVVTLAAMKGSKVFARSALVRQGRLSVVPLDEAQWEALLSLAAAGPMAPAVRTPGKVRPGSKSRSRARKKAGRH